MLPALMTAAPCTAGRLWSCAAGSTTTTSDSTALRTCAHTITTAPGACLTASEVVAQHCMRCNQAINGGAGRTATLSARTSAKPRPSQRALSVKARSRSAAAWMSAHASSMSRGDAHPDPGTRMCCGQHSLVTGGGLCLGAFMGFAAARPGARPTQAGACGGACANPTQHLPQPAGNTVTTNRSHRCRRPSREPGHSTFRCLACRNPEKVTALRMVQACSNSGSLAWAWQASVAGLHKSARPAWWASGTAEATGVQGAHLQPEHSLGA